jgi:hypothetical protein
MPEKIIWDILNRNLFFVKNAVRTREAKTSDKLDIYDPESCQILLECREPNIGILTKVARLFGGRHDTGTEFDLVASIPESQQQVLRVARGTATLSFGGPAVKIFDNWDSLIGKLKQKNFALGQKFNFAPEKEGSTFTLQIKNGVILCDDKRVAHFSKWNSDFFKENKFNYAFSINQEVPANSQIRQVLLAFAIAQHRIIIQSSLPIPL